MNCSNVVALRVARRTTGLAASAGTRVGRSVVTQLGAAFALVPHKRLGQVEGLQLRERPLGGDAVVLVLAHVFARVLVLAAHSAAICRVPATPSVVRLGCTRRRYAVERDCTRARRRRHLRAARLAGATLVTLLARVRLSSLARLRARASTLPLGCTCTERTTRPASRLVSRHEHGDLVRRGVDLASRGTLFAAYQVQVLVASSEAL